MQVNGVTPSEPHRRHVVDLIDRLIPKLFLHEYQWQVEWACRKGHESATAHIDVDPRYLCFDLFFNDEKIKTEFDKGKEWTLANIVVHELCHILTEPLYTTAFDASNNTNRDYIEGIRERQTQRIANVVLATLPKDFYAIRPRLKRR